MRPATGVEQQDPSFPHHRIRRLLQAKHKYRNAHNALMFCPVSQLDSQSAAVVTHLTGSSAHSAAFLRGCHTTASVIKPIQP